MRMYRVVALLVVHATLFLAADVCGQNLVTYPQATLTAGGANAIPFGEVPGSPNSTRSQILVPAPFLPPTGGTVIAVGVIAGWPQPGPQTQTLTYQSLQIRFDHRPNGSPPLSNTFAQNLGPAPQSVLAVTNHSVSYAHRVPHAFRLTTPFGYNGTDDLLIDIQKVLQPSGSTVYMLRQSNPIRTDLPQMLLGALSSPTGQTQAPLFLRLEFDALPTVQLDGPRATTQPRLHFQIGNPFTVSLFGTSASNLGAVGMRLNCCFPVSNGFLPAPMPIPGVRGALWLNPVGVGWLLPPFAPITASGVASVTLGIPFDPILIGLEMTFQGVELDAARNTLTLTNGANAFVNG